MTGPTTVRIVCCLLGSCLVSPALAVPAKPAQEPGAQVHDGFYLRLATGLGAYTEQANSETHEYYEGRMRASTRGFAVANEFAMGGTPLPGLVIGGGVYTTEVFTSSVTVNKPRIERPGDMSLESRDLSIVGVFVDRYFVSSLGVHAQAALGISSQLGFSVNTGDFGRESSYTPVGPGLMLGFGVEMWIADQWSLGVLARFSNSVLFGKDSQGARWVHYASAWPTFLMTVTYH